MRLIDTHTGKFEEFVNVDEVPRYAILSHTWDKDGEQTYQEVLDIQGEYGLLPARKRRKPPRKEGEPSHATSDAIPDVSTPISEVHAASVLCTSSPAIPSIWDPDSGLSQKVREACNIARRGGYDYIWIDSCCINKESSSELSEAINSMFNWYRDADVCYAFLVDVPHGDLREEDSEFRQSRWFKRGWTLQELVAPFALVFLSQDWQYLGSKTELGGLITEITSIDVDILTHKRDLGEESVANRMRWAARRETTRVEDQAYSLLGIFGITMPTLYGEGENAFRRLQEQILERIPDHSIFVWGDKDAQPFPVADPKKSSPKITLYAERTDTATLLAPSPRSFRGASNLSSAQRIIRPMEDSIRSLELPLEEYTRTPYGVRTQLCLLPLGALNPNVENWVDNVSWYLVVLRSQYANDRQRLFCRLCYKRTHDAQVESLYLPSKFNSVSSGTAILDSLFTLPIYDIFRIQKTLKQPNRTGYLPHPKLHDTKPQLRGVPSGDIVSLSLPTLTLAVLQADGYTVTHIRASARANNDSESSFSFVLSNEIFKIHIHYRCMKPRDHNFVAIAAQVWILSPGAEVPETNTRFQLSPPYSAAIWTADDLWTTTLPAQYLHLAMDSEESTTLRLGLRLISRLRYDIHVDVGSSINLEHIGTPLHHHSKELLHPMPRPLTEHEALNLILTRSAQRALNSKGYSAHLVIDPSLRPSYGSHTLTLTSTDTSSPDNFAIVVKYFDTVQSTYGFSSDSDLHELVIVARVTVESGSMSLKTVQDGPYFVQWLDSAPWNWRLEQKCVVLTTPAGALLTLQLGLDLAWKSEYYLIVDIEPATPSPTPQEISPIQRNARKYCGLQDLQNWSHDSIRLTLPGDDRRALQAQGYQVDFEALREGDQSDGRVSHRLTLSHVDVTIIIEYFHDLTTHYPQPDDHTPDWANYPFFLADRSPQTHLDSKPSTPTAKAQIPLKRCNQELTFRASVRTMLPVCSVQKGTPSRGLFQGHNTTATVDWNAKTGNPSSWDWSLQPQQITITLPSGRRLRLNLNLHLGWFSEYCLAVDIVPLKRRFHVDVPRWLNTDWNKRAMSAFRHPRRRAQSPDGQQRPETGSS